jgi:predicted CXXCH cytochrome family protein
MFKRTLIAILGALLLAGCSQAALDKAKRFFFEVPEEAPADATADAAATTEGQPELTLPVPRYASVHRPVVERRCGECHLTTGLMQVRDDLAEACEACHERFFGDDIEHSPIADGECRSCHTLHRSKHDHLLVAPAGETCLDCHDSAEDLSEEAHGQPDAEHCTRCHDPHFGESPYLKADQPEPSEETEDSD